MSAGGLGPLQPGFGLPMSRLFVKSIDEQGSECVSVLEDMFMRSRSLVSDQHPILTDASPELWARSSSRTLRSVGFTEA